MGKERRGRNIELEGLKWFPVKCLSSYLQHENKLHRYLLKLEVQYITLCEPPLIFSSPYSAAQIDTLKILKASLIVKIFALNHWYSSQRKISLNNSLLSYIIPIAWQPEFTPSCSIHIHLKFFLQLVLGILTSCSYNLVAASYCFIYKLLALTVTAKLNLVSVGFVQHVPRINGEIPSVDEEISDHQRLLDR